MLGVFLSSLALLLGVGLSNERPAEAAVTTFEVGLSGLEENPVVNSPGYGFARFTFDDTTRVLTYAVTVSGLSAGEVTAAHIHRGAVGVNGPIVHFLSATGFTQVAGSITLSEADVADLKAGNFYANIHSVQNPGGFARGQMFLNLEDALKATGNRIVAAFNSADPIFFSYFTDAGIETTFDMTREEALELGGDFFEGNPPLALRAIRVQSSSGSTAVTETDLAFGGQLDTVRHEWVIAGGGWKIDSETDIAERIPSGVRVVDVKMQEFAFVVDTAALASGNVALALDNIGKQPHEAIVVKIERPGTIPQILEESGPDEGPPEGIIDVGFGFAEPGEQSTVVFAQPLTAGRYGILCFVPDAATQTPHALLGMFKEFTVGAGAGGGTVQPPSTGDAGLLDSGSTSPYLLIALLTTTLFSGGALVVMTVRR
jgi:hypothetical protein